MQRTMLATTTETTTDAENLDTLARRAPATDDLLAVADWLTTNGGAHLSTIERIELAERLITRRRFLIGAGALGLGVLTGCGAEEEVAIPTATSAYTNYPRTVEHAGGTTTLETLPTRIYVARPFYELDVVLALGVVPAMVGMNPGFDYFPWQVEAGANQAEILEIANGPNLESLVAADIDLIVTNELFFKNSEEANLLRDLAPTIALPFGINYAEQLRIIGECLDLSLSVVSDRVTEAEALIDSFQIANPPASISGLYSYETGTIFVLTSDTALNQLFERIGLPALRAPEPELDGYSGDRVLISLENIGKLDAEALLGFAFLGGGEEFLTQLEAEPVFQNLPAVRGGNYHRLNPPEAEAVEFPSILSLPTALEKLERVFSV